MLPIFSEQYKLIIPRVDPYKLPNSPPIHALNPELPINFVLSHSNSSIQGLEKMKISQTKYIN